MPEALQNLLKSPDGWEPEEEVLIEDETPRGEVGWSEEQKQSDLVEQDYDSEEEGFHHLVTDEERERLM